jgi:hypothetical protein
MMASVEACEAETIVEVYVVAIGETFFISFAVPKVVETLRGKTIGLGLIRFCDLKLGRQGIGRGIVRLFATSVVFIHISDFRNWYFCRNTSWLDLRWFFCFENNLYLSGGLLCLGSLLVLP